MIRRRPLRSFGSDSAAGTCSAAFADDAARPYGCTYRRAGAETATASFSAQSDSKILFLAYVTIPPVEAMAVVNYANNYLPGLVHDSGLLTSTGFMVSMVLLAVMVGFNFLAIRLVLAINLPIAVIGTIVIGAAVFILLQYAFVASIPPDTLARNGWSGLTFTDESGPFAGLAVIFGASWRATVLYADAIVSPGVCGFIWSTSGSRIIMAGGESETMPSFTAWINNNGTPWVALIVVYVIGVLFDRL